MPVHETELNFVRFGTIALNKANILGLTDALVNQSIPTISDLKQVIAGTHATLNNLVTHETNRNYTRQINNILDKVSVNGFNYVTNAEIDAATTFTGLRDQLTEEVSNITDFFPTSLDFGEQPVS